MPFYNIKSKDRTGRATSQRAESISPEVLEEKMLRLGHTEITIQPSFLQFDIDNLFLRFNRIKTEDRVMYVLQLSNMIGSGLSLYNSLNILCEQLENKRLKKATQNIVERIKTGSSFSEALKKHADIFAPLFINMVAAGEIGGNLEDVLKRLAGFAEKEAEMQSKITSAMFYPVILMVFGVLVVSLIVVTIIPTFVGIFTKAGVPLPLPTMMLYQLSNIIRGFGLWIFLGIVGLVLAYQYFKTDIRVKRVMDQVNLASPISGDLVRKIIVARFSRTLSALLSSGIPMLKALETTEKTLDNTIMSRTIKHVYDSISKGANLSEPLKESGQFPPMVIQMVAVGEETGNLDVMLGKIADFYELSTDHAIKRMVSLLEPLMLVFIGGLVALIFASIILPMFRMVHTLKH